MKRTYHRWGKNREEFFESNEAKIYGTLTLPRERKKLWVCLRFFKLLGMSFIGMLVTSVKSIIHFAIDFLVIAVFIWGYQRIGWLPSEQILNVFENQNSNQLFIAGMAGLIFAGAMWTLDFLFSNSQTIGCGCAWPALIVGVSFVFFFLISPEPEPYTFGRVLLPLKSLVMAFSISIVGWYRFYRNTDL